MGLPDPHDVHAEVSGYAFDMPAHHGRVLDLCPVAVYGPFGKASHNGVDHVIAVGRVVVEGDTDQRIVGNRVVTPVV